MQPYVRATLCLGVIVLVAYICALVAHDRPVQSFAPLYSIYTLTLLLLVACTLHEPQLATIKQKADIKKQT